MKIVWTKRKVLKLVESFLLLCCLIGVYLLMPTIIKRDVMAFNYFLIVISCAVVLMIGTNIVEITKSAEKEKSELKQLLQSRLDYHQKQVDELKKEIEKL